MRLRQNTAYLTIFNLVNSASQLIIIAIISHSFTEHQYATYRQTFLPFEIMAPLLSLGFTTSIFYFFPRTENKKELIAVLLALLFTICVLLETVLALGGSLALSSLFENDSLTLTYTFLGVYAFFSLANNVLYSFYILTNRARVITIYNLSINLFSILFVLIIIFWGYSIYFAVFLRFLCVGTLFLILLRNSLIFKYPSSFKILKQRIFLFLKFDYIKTLLTYSIPIALSTSIGTISYNLSSLIVSSLTDPESYAVYANGAIELPFIGIVTTAIATATLPALTDYIKSNDTISAYILFSKSTLASATILIPCFVFFSFYSRETLMFIFGSKYEASYVVFRVYLLLLPIRIINYGNVLVALGKTNILVRRSIVEIILNISLSAILVNIYGIVGAALGTVISILIWTVPYNLLTISRGLGVSIFGLIPTTKILKIFLVALFVAILIRVCKFESLIAHDLLRLPIVFIFFTSTTMILVSKLHILPFRFFSFKPVKLR